LYDLQLNVWNEASNDRFAETLDEAVRVTPQYCPLCFRYS